MPSTEFLGFTGVNLGPLTTTFTAAASCATQSTSLGYYSNYNETGIEGVEALVQGYVSCNQVKLDSCYPSGKELEEKIFSHEQQSYYYFSPAVACPKGWETAGVLEVKAQTTSGSGAFDIYEDVLDSYKNASRRYMNMVDYFANVLEPDEALALCCPSGWRSYAYGGCWSSIAPVKSETYSELCRTYVETTDGATISSMDGTTFDPPYITYKVQNYSTVTEDLSTMIENSHWDTNNMFVATSTVAIAMVYHKTDLGAATATSNNNGGGDDKGDSPKRRAGIVWPIAVSLVSALFGAGLLAI